MSEWREAQHSYADKSVAEIVHDYAVTRGDLSEQYARDQLTRLIEARISEHVAAALNEAADAIHIQRFAVEERKWGGPDNYYNGAISAARIVRAATPKPPAEPDVAARPAGRTPGTT